MNICITTVNDDVGYDAPLFRREFGDFLYKSPSSTINVVADCNAADRIIVIDMHMCSPRQSYSKLIRSNDYQRNWSRYLVYDESDTPNVFGHGLFVSQPKQFYNVKRHLSVPYWSTPLGAVDSDAQILDESYLMSFQGNTATHHVRSILKDVAFTGYHFVDTNALKSVQNNARHAHRSDYIRLILSTRWSLCPRGYGTSSFRLYETMLLGMNPVIISDNFVPPKLLGNRNSITIPERQVSKETLFNLAHTRPVSSLPLTYNDISESFSMSLNECPFPVRKLSTYHCALNAVLWRIFKRYL